ncbi:MAG: hypothetical protein JW888_10830 [Pirellulales bacterium]|nr:hypothetical protein [Pirellulales bacterium]
MAHPLEQKLVRLRRRVRRWLVAHGLSRLITAAVGAALVLGLVDYVFRFQDRGIRVMLTAALLAMPAWACYRWLCRAWSARLGPLDLARQVGSRFPELGDGLPSAVEFLGQSEDDRTAGSAALRRAVIATTKAKAERVDFATVLDRRPVVRAMLLAVGTCLLAGIFVLLDVQSSQIALARLVDPLGSVTWPRENYLRLLNHVDRVARGQPFQVEVKDAFNAKLPPRVDIHYRFDHADNSPAEEVQPMHRIGSIMVARRDNVTEPFAYRIEGGDDRSMDWIEVQVVEPPAIASLNATIRPPDYTGRPASQSTGQLQLLRGSRVSISALATKPLSRAELHSDDDRIALPCWIGQDGRHFSVGGDASGGFVPEQSGFYWFDLVDREGIHGGQADRWEIQLVDDRPPSVDIELPSETTFVTPRAVLPVRVTAKDDLAIRRIDLGVEPVVGDDGVLGPKISLYEGPPRAMFSADASPGQQRTVDYRWDLAALRLRPGTQLTFHVSAEDYSPQFGKSASRRIVVVRPEELIDRLADRQQRILAELARTLNIERESRQQVGQLRSSVAAEVHLDQAAIDRLRAAELSQREAHWILTDATKGIPGQVKRLLADLRNNRLDSPDVERRMDALSDELSRLDRDVLPVIAREMTAAIKTAETRLERNAGETAPPSCTPSSGNEDQALKNALVTIGAGQDEVIASLERLSNQWNQWNDYRRFHRRWIQLLRRQELLVQRTNSLGRDLLGKTAEDVSPETAARLRSVADDQLELARHLDQLLQEMDQSCKTLADFAPLATETISHAIARSRELDIASRMRAAGNAAARNRLGRATTLQAGILADLRDILDLLSNRRRHEWATLVEKLPEMAGQLADLIRRQAMLREQMRKETGTTGENQSHRWTSLGRQQAQLQTIAERLASQLTQLLANEPVHWIRKAAKQMGQASRAAAVADTRTASQRAHEAEMLLTEAAARLAQQMQQIQTNAADEQLARLEATLASLHKRQQQAADETRQLEDALRVAGSRTTNQIAALRRLAADQQGLRKETNELAVSLKSARLFRRVLDETTREMAMAAGWLARQNTDQRVQTAQAAASGRLARLIESLHPTPSEPKQAVSGGTPATAANNQAGTRPDPKILAQLRLLKLLQQDLFVRTQEWDERFGGLASLPAEAERQYKQLSREQGQLADALFELTGNEATIDQPPQDGPVDQP